MISRKMLIVLALAALLIPGTAAASAAEMVSEGDDGGAQRFRVSLDAVADFAFHNSGVFNTPVGAAGPGPLSPGGAYEWTFHAAPGDRLSFATMLVQSNDWFLAPAEPGIPLHLNGGKMTGDVTAYVTLWDAGTEGHLAPGAGANQAPRQSGPDTGPEDPTPYVRHVLTDLIPRMDQLVRVTLRDGGSDAYVLRIENVSAGSSFPTPLAPGVGLVHTAPAPLFVNGARDFGAGLEGLAEDGDPAPLAAVLAARTGVNTPLAPVAYTVHREFNPLFVPGGRASAGLEQLAEDGNPAALVALLPGDSGAAAIGRGASGPHPIAPPDGNYSVEVTARPGDHLSLATMFVQSNDWFFALHNQPLFDAGGHPIVGNFTHAVRLYDAGTEVDEPIGFGSNQAPRQSGPNTGPAEAGLVQLVTQARYANAANVLRLTITPLP